MKNLNAAFIKKQSALRALQQRLNELQKLTQVLLFCLPEDWRPYCQIVRLDLHQEKVVLSTSEQSLLTPLRFMQNQLLTQLKRSPLFRGVQSIEFVYTPEIQSIRKNKSALLQSEDAANACQEAAANCPPALQKALMKLGKTLRKS